ncbi:hypothetical protein HanPI659440_Chr04g0182621 [Helianthus annuus]|nr:hypothetical protein HanPI659440_Chr04g0182621 [Helianthus annuus]
MGICTSCYSGNSNAVTVKLILLDGQLREYSSPVKVFLVAPPLAADFSSFICNADEIDFDKYVTAMREEEELRPGQLYFQLPESWFKRRLMAEDMASLAAKAGKALMGNGGGKVRCGCCVKRVDPLVFCDDDDEMMSSRSTGGGDDVGNHRGGGGKGRMFTMLERIVE